MDLRRRIDDRIRAWRLTIDHEDETDHSILVYGRRAGLPVVLKVVKHPLDEWTSGRVLEAFEGKGMVRVLDHVPGAALLERLSPGGSLAAMAMSGDDPRATEILADVIGAMSPREPPAGVPALEDWARDFEHRDLGPIPGSLVDEARGLYARLCASQSRPRLLHGDLHHGNVLRDDRRGWVAIDPKGVVGETAYETGAALRNPLEKPDLFLDPAVIESRVRIFQDRLRLDPARILGWGFAQAVLAAVRARQDGLDVDADHPWIALARTIRTMPGQGA